MPGLPFGPIRLNTRAALPLTERVLVPAVKESAAAGSGAVAARAVGRKEIVPAMATPDARISRRGRSVGLSLSLISACSRQTRSGDWPPIQLNALERLLCFRWCCRMCPCRAGAGSDGTWLRRRRTNERSNRVDIIEPRTRSVAVLWSVLALKAGELRKNQSCVVPK